MRGAAGEVVEGGDAADDRSEGGGDCGVRGVGEVLLTIDGVPVHRCAEGRVNHADGAVEVDARAGLIDLDVGEAVAGEPGSHEGQVAVGGSEGSSEGLRSEPLVKGGG